MIGRWVNSGRLSGFALDMNDFCSRGYLQLVISGIDTVTVTKCLKVMPTHSGSSSSRCPGWSCHSTPVHLSEIGEWVGLDYTLYFIILYYTLAEHVDNTCNSTFQYSIDDQIIAQCSTVQHRDSITVKHIILFCILIVSCSYSPSQHMNAFAARAVFLRSHT